MQATQSDAKVIQPPSAPAAAHRDPLRRRAVSLLGTSVFARLSLVAGISAVLWIAIVGALV